MVFNIWYRLRLGKENKSIEHKTDGKKYLFSTDRPETYTHRSYTGQLKTKI